MAAAATALVSAATARPVQFVIEAAYCGRPRRRSSALLIVLSPAKKLDFNPPAIDAPVTPRRCADETAELAKVTRELSRADLRRLMSISDALAELNYQRFQAFDNDASEGALQAVFAFAGDVYEGLRARELDAAGLARLEQQQRQWPQNPQLQYLAGQACLQRQLWGKAAQLLGQARSGLQDATLLRRTWRSLALLAEERGDEAAAREAWKQAALLD